MLYTSNAIYRQLNAALRSHFGKTNNLQLGTWQKPGVYVGLIGLICLISSFNWFNLQRSKTEAESATTGVLSAKNVGFTLDFHAVFVFNHQQPGVSHVFC